MVRYKLNYVCRTLLGLASIFLMPIGPSLGAALTEDTSGTSECTLLLDGPIVSGDLERFHDRFGSLQSEDGIEGEQPGAAVLCLNSPGGDYHVGLEIAEYLLTRSETIQTRVKAGHSCASACTFIFLAGRTVEEGESIQSSFDRAIEPGGLLGFHAPRMVLEDESYYASSVVTQAYGFAIDGARQAYELAQVEDTGLFGEVQSFAPPYVVSRFLGTPPEQIYNIDTVGDAILAGIPAYNYAVSVRLDNQLIRTICDNTFMMRDTGFGEGLTSRWKSSRYLDAKSLITQFRNLPFVQGGGVELVHPDGHPVKRQFEEYIVETQRPSIVGFATGYPDGYVGEAICVVEFKTDARPGQVVDFGFVYGADAGVSYDFSWGNLMTVGLVNIYTATKTFRELLEDGELKESYTSIDAPRTPLALFPFDMPLSELPMPEQVSPATQETDLNVQELSCEELWYKRNLVMHQNGYCFGTAKGLETFGNEGCHTKSPTLTDNESAFVTSLRKREKLLGC